MTPITNRHVFGWKCEKILQPFLEQHLGQTLSKTSNRFNSIDYRGNDCIAELKSRPTLDERGERQDSKKYQTWLLPSCKVIQRRTLEDGTSKRVWITDKNNIYFFYFWEADNSLWALKYDRALFKTFLRGVPVFSEQEHFFIPSHHFQKLDYTIPQIPSSTS